jgi:hypothetical protein
MVSMVAQCRRDIKLMVSVVARCRRDINFMGEVVHHEMPSCVNLESIRRRSCEQVYL